MAVRKIQTKRRCICYTRKASKNEENLRTQAHDVESVRITRLDDGEKLRKREYSRELLSIYGEEITMRKSVKSAVVMGLTAMSLSLPSWAAAADYRIDRKSVV